MEQEEKAGKKGLQVKVEEEEEKTGLMSKACLRRCKVNRERRPCCSLRRRGQHVHHQVQQEGNVRHYVEDTIHSVIHVTRLIHTYDRHGATHCHTLQHNATPEEDTCHSVIHMT